MTRFVPDTNCMIAAVCTWHEHHERATEEIEHRLERGEALFVAAHTLVEAYSVLTRLPPPYRLSPADALALIEENFIEPTRIITLEARSYRTFLRRVRDEGIHGGRTYDAIIATCALKARATTLLTFNKSHFLPFEERGLTIVVPGEGGLT
ncbi:MAG: PIN domain-containing protein [Candidatus Tectomicrobia bacterium]|nr:PIN domain-containing protein [Candidatus Tectomicrobia bacterium]